MRPVLGIDLGTTNSAMAIWNGSEAEVIPNERGSRITPSVVAMTENGEILVGESAVNQTVVNPESTVFAVKRQMGSRERLRLGGAAFSPEEISAAIIRKLRYDAEAYLGQQLHDAVITVPAYFTEQQRRATVEAGRLAGMRVQRVLNEPTAAALAYASRERIDQNILVYDLGGGTFDVTCLQQRGLEFRVLATAGDAQLGGMDFTRLMHDEVAAAFCRQSGLELEDPVIRQQLLELVERGKLELSSRETADIGFPFIGIDGKPLHLHRRIQRVDFNRTISALVERSVELTLDALRQAELCAGEIDALVLSGGSSRIPLIRTRLQQELGCRTVSQVNPDEIVALGAAIQASLLQHGGEMSLRDITPFDLGVEIDAGRFVPVLQRNSSLPALAHRLFTTVSDDQTAAEIHVLQGNHGRAQDNTSLGRFLLPGIRRGKQGSPRIRIEFQVDVDGILLVTAVDRDTGARQRVILSRDTPTIETGQGISQRSRVQSLVTRLEALCTESEQALDKAFLQEAREACSMGRRAVLQRDSEAVGQIKTALETLLIEVQAVGGITNENIV